MRNKRERNEDNSPYMTMEAANAMPIILGRFFVAVNNDERELKMT